MKTKVYIGISIRIIIVFVLPIGMSFISDKIHYLFGDKILNKKPNFEWIEDGYDWGAGHYWFFWMVSFLWILSVVNAIIGACNLVNKNYK